MNTAAGELERYAIAPILDESMIRVSVRHLLIMQAVIAIVLVSLWQGLWGHPVNEWNERLIRPGMTESDVDRLLGGQGQEGQQWAFSPQFTGTLKEWHGEHYSIQVAFSRDGRVEASQGGFPIYRWRSQEPSSVYIRRHIDRFVRKFQVLSR